MLHTHEHMVGDILVNLTYISKYLLSVETASEILPWALHREASLFCVAWNDSIGINMLLASRDAVIARVEVCLCR